MKIRRATSRTSWYLLLAMLSGCETSNSFVPSTTASAGNGGSNGMMSGPVSSVGGAGVPAANGGAGAATPTGASGSAGTGSGSAEAGTAANMAGRVGMAGTSAESGSKSTPPAAGSSAGTGAAAAGTGAGTNGGCRPAKYTLATRVTLDISWQETLGLMAGNGKAYIWGKLTLQQQSDGSTTTEYRLCGGQQPVYMSSPLGGSIKVFQTVPQATFDGPNMPTVKGKVSKMGSMLSVEPGVMLVGITLPDPLGAWPANASASGFMPVDVDQDGKPGVTSVMKNDEGFTGSPTSILQTARVDRNYGAQRLAYTAMAEDPSCADTLEGTAQVTMWDILVIGCHVKDAGDCTADEAAFLEENRPKFQRGMAAWSAKVIPDDSTCAQARQTLAVPGPTVSGP